LGYHTKHGKIARKTLKKLILKIFHGNLILISSKKYYPKQDVKKAIFAPTFKTAPNIPIPKKRLNIYYINTFLNSIKNKSGS